MKSTESVAQRFELLMEATTDIISREIYHQHPLAFADPVNAEDADERQQWINAMD